MEIKLNWLRIENFKGIRNFFFEPNGKNASILGNNATGKTTIQDAWRWLLFNKDSNDKEDTNFTIKPQDENGKDIMSLETIVEAELTVDGKPLKLKKARVEEWIKKTNKFKGHKRVYWFDEEPVNATVYQSKVNELVNESIFKMVTNIFYFNTQMEWKKQRNVLFEVFIKDTDEEIILSNERISNLAEILNGKTIESYRAIVKEKIKGLREEREGLPPRISEVMSSLPNQEPDYTAVESEINKYKQDLASIEWLLVSARDKADELNKKYQELAKMNSQLEEIKANIKAESGADKKKLLDEKTDLEGGKLLLQSGINNLQMQIDQAERTLSNNAAKREMLIKEWKSLNSTRVGISSEQFEVGEMTTNCPMCGQEIPKEKIDSQIGELKANFEKTKERLDMNQILIEQNTGEGKAIKENTDKTSKDLLELQTELNQKLNQINQITSQSTALDQEIAKPVAEPDYTKNQEYNELLQKIQELQTELDKPVEDKSSELLQKKAEIQVKIDECNKVLNGKAETEKKKERIDFLKSEEKRISNLIAELEGHNNLIEEFYVIKTGLVNSNFKHVRFRFFEDNDTNEGKKEMCVAEVNTNGSYVKFQDANLAGQINAGLDIINFLSSYYGVHAPIFIDNRESVSEIIKTDSQVINLIKPPTWDELDREVQRVLAGVEEKEEYSKDDIANFHIAKKAWNDRNKSLRVEVEE